MTADEFEPIAEDEIKRLELGLRAIEAEVDMPRIVMPDDDAASMRRATVTDPKTGAWEIRKGDNLVDAGEYWLCLYCDWNDQCIADAG